MTVHFGHPGCLIDFVAKASGARWILLFPVSVAPGPLLGEGDGSTKEEIIVGRILFKIAM